MIVHRLPSPSNRTPTFIMYICIHCMAFCLTASSVCNHPADCIRDHHIGDHPSPTPRGVSPHVPALPPLSAQYPHPPSTSTGDLVIDAPRAHAPILLLKRVSPLPRFFPTPFAFPPPSLRSILPRVSTFRHRRLQFLLQRCELFLVCFFVLHVIAIERSHRHQIIDARLHQLRLLCLIGAF